MTHRTQFIVSVACAVAFSAAKGSALVAPGKPTQNVQATNASSMVGVANWGANYGGQSSLLMGANDSLALGVKNLMVALGPNYNNSNDDKRDYPGTNFNAPTVEDTLSGRSTHVIHSLKDLASSQAFQTVFSMPFQTFAVDASPLTVGDFLNPSNPATAYQTMYTEYYNLIAYLMQTYKGSGKTFILKNWEGDNAFYYEGQKTPINTQIQNMRVYLLARHDALVQARQDFAADTGVTIQDAIEINSVSCARTGKTPCMLKDVVPYVPSDMISYSAYETVNTGVQSNNLKGQIDTDLSYIQNYPGENGRSVMIGEFGFGSNALQEAGAAAATSTALSEFMANGVPYAFDWQIKDSGGADTTLGLIDADGNKTASWSAVHTFVSSSNSGTLLTSRIQRAPVVGGMRLQPIARPMPIMSGTPNLYRPLSEQAPALSAALEETPTSLAAMRNMAIRASAHNARTLPR